MIPRFKTLLPPADTEVMEKRTLLWGLGYIAFGFMALAAVNAGH